MDDFIERGSKLYDFEELSWTRGDILGIVSAQQAQKNLESELYSQETVPNKPSWFGKITRNVGNYILGGMAVVGLALTGAAKDMIPSLDDTIDYFSAESTTHLVPYSGVVQENPITDGQNIVLEENGKIVAFDTTDATFTQGQSQIEGLKHLRIDNGSLSFQKLDSEYKLFAEDSEGFLNVIESAPSGAEPTWYTAPHHSDGTHILRAGDNGGVVRENIVSGEEQIIYSSGLVSKLRIDGDLNLFVAEEDIDGSTHERVWLVDSNDAANTKVIYDGPVEFLELSNESIYVGIQNPQDYQTINLHVFDLEGNQAETPLTGLNPNSFDVDDGIMVKFENNGTIYAVDVATGAQTVVTDSSSVKSNIDLEDSIAAWREDGTRVAYNNEISSELLEEANVYANSNVDNEFELNPQRIFINSEVTGIDTDGSNIIASTKDPYDMKVINLDDDNQVTNFTFSDDIYIQGSVHIDNGIAAIVIMHQVDDWSLYYKNINTGHSEEIFESQTTINTDIDIDAGRIIFDTITGVHIFNSATDEIKSLDNITQEYHTSRLSGDHVAFSSEGKIYITNDEFAIFEEISNANNFEMEGNQLVYIKSDGVDNELWLYNLNNKTKRLLIDDFFTMQFDEYSTAPDIDFSNGNISWGETNFTEDKSEIHIYNIEQDSEVVLGEFSGIISSPRLDGNIITWIGDFNTVDTKAYFADITGLNFNKIEESSIQNDNNQADLEQLLERISILENETSSQQEYSNQVNQTLADVRQEWANENATRSAEVEGAEEGTNYGLWIGTAAATLAFGGFLLHNRQIKSLKRRTIDPISELVGFDTDNNSKSLIVPREAVGIDPQGNIVVHVHGDQYNTMMQGDKEANVNAYIGNVDDE